MRVGRARAAPRSPWCRTPPHTTLDTTLHDAQVVRDSPTLPASLTHVVISYHWFHQESLLFTSLLSQIGLPFRSDSETPSPPNRSFDLSSVSLRCAVCLEYMRPLVLPLPVTGYRIPTRNGSESETPDVLHARRGDPALRRCSLITSRRLRPSLPGPRRTRRNRGAIAAARLHR